MPMFVSLVTDTEHEMDSTQTSNSDSVFPSKKQIKAKQKLDKLLEKENLSNRDALKMATLVRTLSDEDRKNENKYEQIERKTIHSSLDSMALLRDTTYWKRIRTQPLTPKEMEEYQVRDSLKRNALKSKLTDSLDFIKKLNLPIIKPLLLGRTWHINRVSFGFNGVLRAMPEYNFVEGVWLG